MVWIISLFTILGINFTFWMLAGLFRLVWDRWHAKKKRGRPSRHAIHLYEVAAVIPAHNEEMSIRSTIRALKEVLPANQIYIANDDSTDDTAKIAWSEGVNVNNIHPNVGKAKALVDTFEKFDMYEGYKAILIHDADVAIHKDYMKYALPHFDDRDVACVAPHQVTTAKKLGFWESFFVSYRVRLWRILQPGMRYGMTFQYTNVTYIVPGGLSVYRTNVLKQLDIDAPGLIIEDFNMTFELRRKKLGRVAYDMRAKGFSQDPYYLSDYIKQVRRWSLGFWQAALRNGVWPSLFWLSTGGFVIEMFLYALFIISIPLIVATLVISSFGYLPFSPSISWWQLFLGLFVMDYSLTVFAAILERNPRLLYYGIGFFFLRYVDSILYIITLPAAFSSQSSGRWASPRRKF